MKALNIWIALLLCFTFTTNQLFADTHLQLQYKYEYLKAFAVTMQNLEHNTHSIELKDMNGVVLIQEKINQQTEFGRMYNLEELPEGTYRLVVENEQQIIIQPITINRRFLTINRMEQKEIIKPAIKVTMDVIAINMLHFEKEAISFFIKNDQGETIYTDSFNIFGSLNKQLNISRLARGGYDLLVQTNAYTVTKHFNNENRSALLVGEL